MFPNLKEGLMKRFALSVCSLVLAVALVFAGAEVFAQQNSPGAPVTQTGSTGLAATTCLNAVGNASASAQQTLTIPAPGGANSIYLDYLQASLSTIATPVSSAGAFVFTTTNFAGTPQFPVGAFGPVVSGGNLIPAAGANGPLGIPIKSLAGVSPTVVGPAANATYGQQITGCWHVAP